MEATSSPPQLTKQERRQRKKERKRTAQQKEKSRLFKKIGLWSALVLSGVGLVFFFKLKRSSTPKQPLPSVAQVALVDQTKGQSEAQLLLVEYSDFQCPACGRYYPLLKKLDQELGAQIQFVYRHFPLRQIHRNAEIAARAAEAAGQQGKFWEMHDWLFENQTAWSEIRNPEKIFIQQAQALDLEIEQFKADIKSTAVKNKIRDDYTSGIKAGVDATPSLFLNGTKLQNPRSYEELKQIIEKALEQDN